MKGRAALGGFIRTVHAVLDLITAAALLLVGAFSAWALWDNSRVYASAQAVRPELKPRQDEGHSGPDFSKLLAVSPDLRAWLTLEGTGVDYPVMQGEDNLRYLNTDVYGNFSLAGSIFLDSLCAGNFSDSYNLLYGHHMEKGRMFGDLERYRDGEFFAAHRTGELLVPGGGYDLEIIACLCVSAADERIFDVECRRTDAQSLGECLRGCAVQAAPDGAARVSAGEKLLAMSTCSDDFGGARTVVLAVMTPQGG